MTRPRIVDPELRFITRHPSYAGWRLAVQFGSLKLPQEYFGDAYLGGKEAALATAKLRRDRLVVEHRIPMRNYDGNGYCVINCNNKSGVTGINLAVDNPKNPTRVGWSVSVQQNGKAKKAYRSIIKYGYAGAWQFCAAIRERHTGLKSTTVPPPPEWLIAWATSRGATIDMTLGSSSANHES